MNGRGGREHARRLEPAQDNDHVSAPREHRHRPGINHWQFPTNRSNNTRRDCASARRPQYKVTQVQTVYASQVYNIAGTSSPLPWSPRTKPMCSYADPRLKI